MNIVEREDGTIDLYIRQSNVNEMITCAERGRQAILRPDWSRSSETAVIGTAVHAGIAAKLLGDTRPVDVVALEELTRLFDAGDTRFVKHTPAECRDLVKHCSAQWVRDIQPTLTDPIVKVEEHFSFLLDTFDLNGRTIRVNGNGTADLVTATDVWDWKTSGKKYDRWSKQSQAVQPTMYAAAAVAQGLLEWPVRFRYGVMLRKAKSAQIVEVHRTEAHVEWLRMLIRPFIRTFILLGTDEPWPMNDTHFLCNETWCSYWSVCKGAVLAPSDIKPLTLEGTTTQ